MRISRLTTLTYRTLSHTCRLWTVDFPSYLRQAVGSSFQNMFMKIQTLESVLSLCDHLSVCVACACVSAYAWKHARHVSMLSPFAHARRLSAESSETGIGLTLGRLYFQSNAKLNAYVMLNATEYKRFVTHGLPAATSSLFRFPVTTQADFVEVTKVDIFVAKLKTHMKTLARLL